jgi:hypothetical protein
MNFQTFTAGGRTFTAAEQAQAWNAYIEQDKYLSENRGQLRRARRVFLPMVHRTRLQRGAGLLREHRGPPALVPVPGRHPELRQPAQQRLGRRPAPRQRTSRWWSRRPPRAAVDAQGSPQYRLRVDQQRADHDVAGADGVHHDVYRSRSACDTRSRLASAHALGDDADLLDAGALGGVDDLDDFAVPQRGRAVDEHRLLLARLEDLAEALSSVARW